jgi:hypothetical protein
MLLVMAKCVFCKAEKRSYMGSMPFCFQCANGSLKTPPAVKMNNPEAADARQALEKASLEANALAIEANKEFNLSMHQSPSGLPHPDGAQRIKNASSALSIARKAMMKAHTRFRNFLEHGVVPEDLKRVTDDKPDDPQS